MSKQIKTIIGFSLCGFFLNFFWETWHGIYLYQEHGISSIKEYVSMIGYVSSVDAFLLLVIFVVGMLIWKNFFWFQNMNQQKYWYIVVFAMVIAVAIEIKGVYMLHQWSYNELMPIVFGIGISPLLQLAVTGLLSVWFIQKIYIE